MVSQLHGRKMQPIALYIETNINPARRGKFQFVVKGIIKRIDHDTPVGTFAVGETITGGTSTETGEVVHVGTGFLIYRVTSAGPLQSGEVLTGGTSGATANSTTAPADEAHRVIIPMRGSAPQGQVNTVRMDVKTLVDTPYATLIVEVLDTDDVGAVLNSDNTIFRDGEPPLTAPTGAPAKIDHVSNVGRDFLTEGTLGKLQIAITTTGGDNTSDQTWIGQVNGDIHA